MAYPSRVGWRFRNVSQSVDFLPTLESISIDDTNQQDVATFACDIVDPDESQTFDLEDELWVEVGGVKVFGGSIKARTIGYRDEVGSRVYSIEAQDFTARLDDSVIDHQRQRPAEPLAARVDWILSFLNFSITTAGVNLPTMDVDAGDFEGATVREALDQTADEARLSYYVDFDKDLHMFRVETVAAPFDLDNVAPDYIGSFPYREWEHTQDSVELAGATYVIGDKRRVWVDDASSIASWGRQERSLQDAELVTTAQLNNAGLRANAENGQPTIEGHFTCHEPGLQAGMTFALVAGGWEAEANGTYIITEVTITAVDPEDDEGEAYARCEVTYSDRRRARPYRHARSPKPEALDVEEGAAVSLTRYRLEVLRNRLQAYGYESYGPLADSVSFGPSPSLDREITQGAGAHNVPYTTGLCPIGLGCQTGEKIEEQWFLFDGGDAGDVGVRFTVSDMTADALGVAATHGVAYGIGSGTPTDEEQYERLGTLPITGGTVVIPASLIPSGDAYFVVGAAWRCMRGVIVCSNDLPGGIIDYGLFESGQATVALPTAVALGVGGAGRTDWVSGQGETDGSNREYTLVDWSGKGVPEARAGVAILAYGTDYTIDEDAGTATLRTPAPAGTNVAFRYRI